MPAMLQELPAMTLHHVGYVVETIEPAAEAYAERFGYRLVTAVLHDPLQTAKVQFLQLAGDPSYLEFVAPDSDRSKLSAVIKRGARLNHLCYATDSIEAVIEHLERCAMKLISEPRPGVAFAGRRICWLMGTDSLPIELVERRGADDPCAPGLL